VLLRTENLRKEIRNELADHYVCVGYRERAAAAITFRPRIGAGRIRTDAKAGAIIVQDRSAACRNGMDQHHRRAHPHAGDFGFKSPPISKPISREKPAARPVSAMPTTPAAGPDRIASLPRNKSAAVSPPDDIINIRRGCSFPA